MSLVWIPVLPWICALRLVNSELLMEELNRRIYLNVFTIYPLNKILCLLVILLVTEVYISPRSKLLATY